MSAPRWLRPLLALFLAFGIWRAATLAWTCDDAFISIRYARHLVEGQGLVWNPGERVEGFTNPTWTLALAAAMAAGFDPVATGHALGLLSLATIALLLWRLERRFGAEIPLSPFLLLGMEDVLRWATGGLETMTAAALAVGVAALLFQGRPHLASAGALGGILFLTRPDAVLAAAALLAVFAASESDPRARLRAALRGFVPLGLMILAATVARLAYYGDPLPNTFYAKSGDSAWWSQGFTYLGLLLARDWVLVAAPLLAFAAQRGSGEAREARVARGALLAAAAAYALYVVRSGGDFMFARRLVPALPLVVLGLFLGQRRAWRPAMAIAGLAFAGASFAFPVFERWGQGGLIGVVADEPSFYPRDVIELRRAQGEALARTFEGLDDARFAIGGGLAVLADASRLPYFVEIYGLADREIARLPTPPRGRPGHEKTAPPELLDQRRVPFLVYQRGAAAASNLDTLRAGPFGPFLAVRYYDEPLMRALQGRPGVAFEPIDGLVEAFLEDIDAAPCDRARSLFDRLDRYYASRNQSPSHSREALRARAEARCGTP